MIEKSFPVPFSSRYALNFPLSDLKTGGKIRGVHLAHVKEEDGALVCAEAIRFHYQATAELESLFALAHELLAVSKESKYLYTVSRNRRTGGTKDLQCAVNYYDKDGTEGVLVVGLDTIYRLTDLGVAFSKRGGGGTCAARHYERIYVGKGQTVCYSEPMYYDEWNYSAFNAGEIRFPGEQGEIVGMTSYHGKLYLFFEKGILVLTAHADPLDFKVQTLPFGLGINLKNSFADCGDAVYFFTDRGLCRLSDAGCKLVEDADVQDIDLSKPVCGAYHRGAYYASVCNRQGERVLYSYDCVSGRSRFINHVCEALGANDQIYLSSGDVIYELSGKSFPTVGECALTVDFGLDDKSGVKYLESVLVAGTGTITALLTNEKGECVSIKGECGKRLRLPRALIGEDFRLKVLPQDEEFAIRALSFEVRRDNDGN